MKKGYWWFLAGLVATLMIGIALILLLYAPVAVDENVRIRAVTAFGLDDDFDPIEPTSVYGPEDGFYLSVMVENLAERHIFSARWRYRDTVITTQDQVVDGAGGSYTLGFELVRTDEPWPVGDYSVDVLLSGDVVGTARFSVSLPPA